MTKQEPYETSQEHEDRLRRRMSPSLKESGVSLRQRLRSILGTTYIHPLPTSESPPDKPQQ